MAKFRKKPIVIEAIQWIGGSSIHKIRSLNIHYVVKRYNDGTLIIKTLEGDHVASLGDWIIKGVKGELYPCKPDIFEMTYEQCDGIKHLGAKEK